MRSLGWALVQHNWCPYTKGKFGHRDTRGGRSLCEHEGRDWGYEAVRQKAPRIASKSPEAGRQAWARLSLTAPRWSNLAQVVISDTYPPELCNNVLLLFPFFN